MATLENKSIKATLPAVVKYNNNPDKNLPPDGRVAVAAYIRGEHADFTREGIMDARAIPKRQ